MLSRPANRGCMPIFDLYFLFTQVHSCYPPVRGWKVIHWLQSGAVSRVVVMLGLAIVLIVHTIVFGC